MTIKVKTTATQDRTGLFPGDMVEIGTSHELKINGDASWVSYKVATKVQENETAEQAHERALKFLTEKTEQAVKTTVDHVLKMSEG